MSHIKLVKIKKEKIRRSGILTIEIDLSHIEKTITEDELKYYIDSDTENKQWLFWDKAKEILNKFYKVSEILNIQSNGNVYGCPIKRRKWKDKYYARVLCDWNDCDYCIDLCEQDELGNYKKIICSGRSKIASIENFDESAEQRQKE